MADAKADEASGPKMMYRVLGESGLKVSVLGFGTMSFNTLEQSTALVEAARNIGVNFFDNAEVYGEPAGNGEVLFGQALKALQEKDPILYRRSDLVITTKIFMGPNPKMTVNGPDMAKHIGVNELGLNRKHLMEGLDASLKRLQLDYVDVVLAHRFDGVTPMREIVEGFTDLIRQGKAFYWGTSMWPPIKLAEAYWIAQKYDLIAPITEQPVYNMFSREVVENHFVDVLNAPYNLGTTVYSPLDAGILTGKYLEGIPDDSRFGKDRLSNWWGNKVPEEKLKKCVGLKAIADELGISMVNLALAWVLKNPNVSVCLLGASRASQVEQNGGAIAAYEKLTDEVMAKIEEVLDNKPKRDPYLYRDFRPPN